MLAAKVRPEKQATYIPTMGEQRRRWKKVWVSEGRGHQEQAVFKRTEKN